MTISMRAVKAFKFALSQIDPYFTRADTLALVRHLEIMPVLDFTDADHNRLIADAFHDLYQNIQRYNQAGVRLPIIEVHEIMKELFSELQGEVTEEILPATEEIRNLAYYLQPPPDFLRLESDSVVYYFALPGDRQHYDASLPPYYHLPGCESGFIVE